MTALLLALLLATPLPTPAVTQRSVLVLPVMPGPQVDSERVHQVQTALRKQLKEVEGVRFLGTQEDNVKMTTDTWSVMNCATIECSAELGLSLGVPEVLTGSLVYRSGQYTLTFARISTRSMHTLRSSERKVGMDKEQLTRPMAEMVDELYPSDRSCHACVTPPPGGASEVSTVVPLLPDVPPLPEVPAVHTYPAAPDVTWMLPAIAGSVGAAALTVLLGAVPFVFSAVIMPVFTGYWLAAGQDMVFSKNVDNVRVWTVTAFLIPALMGIPLGLAAPFVSGCAALLGWWLPTYLWRRNSLPLGLVLAVSLIPVGLGAVAMTVPVTLGALAATAVSVPHLMPYIPLFAALPVIVASYALAWTGAAAITYATGLAMFLIPPAMVGLTLARDKSPLHKGGEDETPLPVDTLIRQLSDDKHAMR